MDLQRIADSILNGDIEGTPLLVKEAIRQGIPANEILDKGLIAGMSVIGQKFKVNEVFVPEVLIAAKAMHAGLSILEPQLAKSGIKPKAKVIIGTVKGDLHDIGKNLVSMMLKGAGFSVIDLGIDVAPEKFARAVDETKAPLVAMSSLLTTSMPSMKQAVELFKAKGIRKNVKIVIGGAPVTQEFADQIGADGYAPCASTAVEKIKELLGV